MKFFGFDVAAALAELRSSEPLSAEQLNELQRDRLRSILQHAQESVPFYRKRFAGIDFGRGDPYDCLRSLPPLTKGEIRANTHDLLSDRVRPGDCYWLSTSGSTGRPLRIAVDRKGYARYYAAKLWGQSWHSLPVGCPEVRFWGRPMRALARLRQHAEDAALNRRVCSAFLLSDTGLQRAHREILRSRPLFLYGYTGAIARYAQFIIEHALRPLPHAPRVAVCTSETVLPQHRSLIEAALGCSVASEYGSVEIGVVAFECPDGSLHVIVHNAVTEILADGRPTDRGESGELVITSLVNHAMPLIRYRIGDVASWRAEDTACSCGRTLPIMGHVQGRSLDRLVDTNGKPVHAEVFDYAFQANGGLNIARQFKIVQRSPTDLEIIIVPGSALNDAAKSRVERDLRRFLGEDLKCTWFTVGDIAPEPTGKRRFFVSEMGQNL